MKKIHLLSALLFLFSAACSLFSDDPSRVELTYDNIIVYADLSGRLDGQPRDELLVSELLDYFVKDCVQPGVKKDDRSAIQFSRLYTNESDCGKTTIDLDAFDNAKEKARYIERDANSGSLTADIALFAEGVSCHYTRPDGVDLNVSSLLAQEVALGTFLKADKIIVDGRDTAVFSYNNHLILFTDAYPDFPGQGTDPEILRARCLQTGLSIYELLRDCPELRMNPQLNENNTRVHLYLLETEDRRIGESHPKGLSDNDILKAIWEYWAEESGFKSFTWKSRLADDQVPSGYFAALFSNALAGKSSPLLQDFIPYGSPGNCPTQSQSLPPEKAVATPVKPRPRATAPTPPPYTAVATDHFHDYDTIRSSVTIKTATFLSDPDPQQIITTIPSGIAIEVLGYGGRYFKVRIDGQVGYMRETEVRTYKWW